MGPVLMSHEQNNEHQKIPFPERELEHRQLKLLPVCHRGNVCLSVIWGLCNKNYIPSYSIIFHYIPLYSQYQCSVPEVPVPDFSLRHFSSLCLDQDTSLLFFCLSSPAACCASVLCLQLWKKKKQILSRIRFLS